MSTTKIINPETARPILINGPTYQKLIEKGYKLNKNKKIRGKIPKKQYSDKPNHKLSDILSMSSGKMNSTGNRTSGWGDDAPKKGQDRKRLHRKCGNKCFLRPESLNFPICPKNKCEIDCRGVSSAYIRVAQWKYQNIKQLAKKIESQKCY